METSFSSTSPELRSLNDFFFLETHLFSIFSFFFFLGLRRLVSSVGGGVHCICCCSFAALRNISSHPSLQSIPRSCKMCKQQQMTAGADRCPEKEETQASFISNPERGSGRRCKLREDEGSCSHIALETQKFHNSPHNEV